MEFNEEFFRKIQILAVAFSSQTVRDWAINIRQKKIISTRELLDSLDEETKTDLGQLVATIAFAFEEHGRYQEMKSPRWGANPPIDKLLLWIEKKGLLYFGADPKPYKKGKKSAERRKNEIAWGIAKNRLAGKRPKAKPWFQSQFYKNVAALREELIVTTADTSIDYMKAALLLRLKSS